MGTLRVATWLAASVLSGCASYSGSSLIAGKSTAAEVETLMGKPAERIEKPGGVSVFYYPRGPAGRETYAVSIGADGKVLAVEQRLTDANIAKLVPGTTSAREARELLGPPTATRHLPRLPRDVWEYPVDTMTTPRLLVVQFSSDGIVREVFKMTDETAQQSEGSGGM
jgi:hypothetical protein